METTTTTTKSSEDDNETMMSLKDVVEEVKDGGIDNYTDTCANSGPISNIAATTTTTTQEDEIKNACGTDHIMEVPKINDDSQQVEPDVENLMD